MKFLKTIITFFILSISLLSTGQIRGKASFYHNKFHGRKTSSGIKYHKDSLTCAHKTYPFGTLLKVKNLNNDKEVIVKVTDRGPFVRSRIIDVSMEAAKKLGFVAHGITQVEITKLDKNYKTPQKVRDETALLQKARDETALFDSLFVDGIKLQRIEIPIHTVAVNSSALSNLERFPLVSYLNSYDKPNFFDHLKEYFNKIF